MKNKLPEHPFLVMDANSDMEWHKDLPSAIKDAEERIAGYRDESWANGEWDDEAESIVVLKVVQYSEFSHPDDTGGYDVHLVPGDEPEEWPLSDVLKKLTEAAETLMNQYSYDAHGYEEITDCIKRAKAIVGQSRQQQHNQHL